MIREIKTSLDPFQIFTIFRDEDHSFILDSYLNPERLGRYSFIGTEPFEIIKGKDSDEDLFEVLRQKIKEYNVENDSDLPFVGGAVGYISYDACHYIEKKLPRTAIDDINVPDLYFGLYDAVIIVDNLEQKTYVASPGLNPSKEEEKIDRLCERIERAEREGIDPIYYEEKDFPPVELKSNFKKEEYYSTLQKIKDYIEAGDIYQANLTQRFEGNVPMSSYELYRDLRRVSPAPFGAFLNFGEVDILSNSPERFIQLRGDQIETRPIKGTRPRGRTPEEDRMYREELVRSEKDKAELLMIVDLERNDIGRVSETGTVRVPELFKLEEYSNVHHLVATVVGRLREDKDVIDLIKATFPGGSITGAPKIRAMEIIDEVEPTQRNVYTGSIGYLGFDGSLDLNIAIRTMVKKGDKVYFQVGGGIVWDSDVKEEYEETFKKAASIKKALRGHYEYEKENRKSNL
ncbi:aminodeoxychorismate synthase component I [Natranaerofaba carboxydovora]|uniref:aminodeoxychorismate synthase component I n=1 Tax=Natranaerofaba carboxydovora TaxID=2742683 RepID=UPI001F139F33|nr:aminodeoxychorismate synthase component I [Natranaerofaba carboxydovora]UMZ74922.1 Aminodeoxychorismate synthase component 1 [Natranaerofaba carboxydovora]